LDDGHQLLYRVVLYGRVVRVHPTESRDKRGGCLAARAKRFKDARVDIAVRGRYAGAVPDAGGEYGVFLTEDGSEMLAFAPLGEDGSGWARYYSPETLDHPQVFVRFGLPDVASGLDESLVVREVHISGKPRVDAATLRKLGLGRLESAVNAPNHHRILSPHVQGRGLHVPIPAGMWRIEPPTIDLPPATKLALDVPKGRKRWPDRFYVEVADAYAWLATQTRQPAQVLAQENGVAVTTVHGWVKEARSRGFLPPVQRGSTS